MSTTSLPRLQKGFLPLLMQAKASPWASMLLASFVFIGGDLLAVKIGGFTLRLVLIPLMAVFLIDLWRQRGDVRLPPWVFAASLLLVLAAWVSLINSASPSTTVAYTIWSFFTFFIIVPVFANFARNTPITSVLRLWFGVFRLVTALLLIDMMARIVFPPLREGALGGAGGFRPHIWFYEASYVAIYISAYSGASVFLVANGEKWARKDLMLSVFASLLLVSATALFGLIISVCLAALLSPARWKILGGAIVLGAAFLAIAQTYLQGTPFYRLMVGFLLQGGNDMGTILLNIVGRGGGRAVRFLWTWDVFVNHPYLGIGFGADKIYTAQNPVPPIALPFLRPWDDVFGNPFLNPFLEAGATMGIGGIVGLVMLVAYPLYLFFHLPANRGTVLAKAIFVGFAVMFLVVQIEGTFLRFYTWSTFGLAIGAGWRCLTREHLVSGAQSGTASIQTSESDNDA